MDWLQNIPDFLKMSWPELSKVMVGVFLAGFLAYGWVRSVREKSEIIQRDRDRLEKEIAKYEALFKELRETSDRQLKELREDLEERGLRNLQQAGRMADERVEAERAAARAGLDQAGRIAEERLEAERATARAGVEQAVRMGEERVEAERTAGRKELEQLQRSAERELELTRQAAEREAQQLQKQAELREQHLAQAQTRELEHVQRNARAEIDAARDKAARQLQQATADANQAVAAAKASFAASLSETIQRHAAEHDRMQAAIAEQVRRVEETTRHRKSAEQEVAAFKNRQLDRLNKINRVWDTLPLVEPPPFIPATERKTRFIAVANLKGGVGKTTIAGNAGITLACRGHRVLLVDLDFQGSLTQVALERKTLSATVKRYETARALFESHTEPVSEWLDRIIHPVECLPADAMGKCDIIGAWNDLADVELREMARWIMEPETDIRFRIRELFHQPEFCERYDYVIFDCPPRLTTAAINALAAADGVIIPIMLDWQSAAPILYMLRRLKELRPALGGASVMGMVANQVRYNAGKPVQQMQAIFDMVCKRLDAEQLTASDAFRVMVKAESEIGAEVNASRIAAAKPALRPLFRELADSIERVTRHESLALV